MNKEFENGIKYNFFGKKVNVLLVYPNSYFIAMSSLSFLNIYRLLNENPFTSCERFFLDSQTNKSFETKRNIADFDLIIFTISFENDIFNIKKFFQKNNFELNKNKRQNKFTPIFIIGGQIIKIYPFIFLDIFDFVISADFEIFYSELLNYFSLYNEYNKNNFYDFFYNSKIIINDKKSDKFYNAKNIEAYSTIISSDTVFKNTFLIELTRGCPNHCNFCINGYSHNYFNFIDFDKIISIFNSLKNLSNKFGIIGLAVLKYKYFSSLCEFAINNNLELNFSSLDISDLTEDKIYLLKKVNQQTFTIAPENFSEKILKLLNKKIIFNDIKEKLNLLNKYQIENLKIYLLFGFDEENEDDLKTNVLAIKELSNIFKGNIVIRLNPLIPKPKTFFADRKIQSKKILIKKMNYYQKNLSNIKNVSLKFLNLKEAFSQIIKNYFFTLLLIHIYLLIICLISL
ncbi:MAG TPA: radical SAM protein [bacterium]|nr:radical SAM protein [bacterium]HOL46670.1 radical SAM protein [bacterium]HPQ18358.1 radical SAM protein [bacterium]